MQNGKTAKSMTTISRPLPPMTANKTIWTTGLSVESLEKEKQFVISTTISLHYKGGPTYYISFGTVCKSD